MAVIEGGSSGSLVGVGAESALPMHVVAMPVSYGSGGVFSAAATTGTIAAALAANAEIFQFRYVTAASRVALVHSVEVSAGANVAATAAGLTSLRMTVARGWTVAGSGGTRITLPGDIGQLRTSMATSEVNDMGISTTAGLTAGTKTLDATDIGVTAIGIGTGAITTAVNLNLLNQTFLFNQDQQGRHPLVLANQEGFVVRCGAQWPATLTWHMGVRVTWSEVPSF